MNNTKPQDIASLLGQATPRPWKVAIQDKFKLPPRIIQEGKAGFIAQLGYPNEGTRSLNAQLIVLAVNALPALLKLREAAAAVMVECAVDTPPSLGAIANLDAAVVKVDTALGLSPEPSSTPVDTL